jgi:hypothetical protein
MKIQSILFVLLFCIFPARLLIHWLPLLGYPMVATSVVFVEYISLLLLIVQYFNDKGLPRKDKKYKLMHLLFWIYNLYIIYYIILNPVMPREEMAQAPASDFSFIQSAITTSLEIVVVVNYQRYLNVKLFTKISALFMIILLLIYTLTSNMSVYLLEHTLSRTELDKFNISEYGLINTLTLTEFVQMAFILNFIARSDWSQIGWVNKFVLVTSSFLCVAILLICGQRGPVLWLGVTILFYYFAKGKLGKSLTISILAFVFLFSIFGNKIIGSLASHDITLIDRFLSIRDDGGSGRFGNADSVYGSALRQIMGSPLFGSNFRLTMGGYIGGYPHNFIFEYLMTFGLVFTLPLLYLIWQGVKKSYYVVKNNAPMTLFCMLFLNTYLYHLTSFTVVNDTKMWILLAMILCVDKGVATRQWSSYQKKCDLLLYGQR